MKVVSFLKPEDVTFENLADDHGITLAHGYALARNKDALGHFYWWVDALTKLGWGKCAFIGYEAQIALSLKESMANGGKMEEWLEKDRSLSQEFESSKKIYALERNEGVLASLRWSQYPFND